MLGGGRVIRHISNVSNYTTPSTPSKASFFVHTKDRQDNSLSKDRVRLVDLMNQ